MNETNETNETTPEEPKGPAVTYGEFFAYAKHNCKTCFGKGQFLITVQKARRSPDGSTTLMPFAGKEQNAVGRVCGCARNRFMKKHGDAVAWNSNGALAWKAAAP